jgi:hypothetical protein
MGFGLDPALRSVLRAVLALLFLAAASHKLRDFAAFVRALDAYAIVPARLGRAVAACLVAFEVGVAAALISFASSAGPALAAALLGLYSAAIAVNLGRGRFDLDCGCSLGRGGQKLSWWLLARNSALLVAALLATLPPSPRPLTWIDVLTIVGCTAALLLIHHGGDTLLANFSVSRKVLS